ncbi:MAG: DUF262 domain-containing protein [Microbacterium sp.]|nr:DUF262 domain-containing protein [Microbacterium sp.]
MGTAANVSATAVNTIDWLSASDTTIVVPVYQRQYRWDIGGCDQLLADIRAVADLDDHQTHFIGSILSASNAAASAAAADPDRGSDELVLIDGQQRITTLMLLVAALQHTVRESDPALATELGRVLVHSDAPGHTKLRPHRAWADTFERVVLGRGSDAPTDSRFHDNYAFFRSQVLGEEVPRIWRGLRRLEHVAITLGPDANAQQTFESLNSTGEPLRDHELIHNYVLMGLSHREQRRIEDEYWLPIEQATGEAIGAFWRHYLVMSLGREVTVAGERGVYDAFHARFPRLDGSNLEQHAAEWRAYAQVYRVLLDPATAPDAELARQLTWLNTFGSGMYPLVMRSYREWMLGALERAELIATLERIQSLLLRRTVSGLSNERLVARLCRARAQSADALVQAIARVTPSDERVRVALRYGALPHPRYVLGRLAGVESVDDLEMEYVVPLTPGDAWSGDGQRAWSDYSEDEQNSFRALAPTLGNLALLEQPLAERALGHSYPAKRALYARSRVAATASIADLPAWTTAELAARTARLSERFVQVWQRAAAVPIDDDDLTPVLDAKKHRGWPRGWEREWDYTEYRGEHWEVHDVKHLFNRVFKRLWADQRDAVVAYTARHGGPVFEQRAWNGQWDTIDDSHHIYMGWDSRYMLTAVQGVLEEAGIASEVFVKYSYLGAVL